MLSRSQSIIIYNNSQPPAPRRCGPSVKTSERTARPRCPDGRREGSRWPSASPTIRGTPAGPSHLSHATCPEPTLSIYETEDEKIDFTIQNLKIIKTTPEAKFD